MNLLGFGAALVLFVTAVLVQRASHLSVARQTLVMYSLRLPRNMPAAGVEAFWAGWSGSLPPWWKRWLIGVPFLISEIQATRDGITHWLLIPERWERYVTALLSAHLPSVRYQRGQRSELAVRHGAEYRLSTSERPLTVDVAALGARLLAALQPLDGSEAVTIQYVLGPAAPVPPTRLATGGDNLYPLAGTDGVVATSEAATALRQKHRTPLLVGVGRIGVTGASARRARSLLRHVEAAWHGTRAPGVLLRRRWLPMAFVARRMSRRQAPLMAWPGGILNVTEASGLIGWPIEVEQLPGLTLGGCRLLPVPLSVPKTGTVLGIGTYPATERPVALTTNGRLHHVHAVGPTGVGKTVLLSQIALSDLAEPGRGLIVVDAKDGTLIDNILERLPENRIDDVIVLDPTDDRPVGFDPLRSTPASRELVVDRLVSIMAAIWKAAWGPRSSDLTRHALLTLTSLPGFTICEVPAFLADAAFRRAVLGRVNDANLQAYWAAFSALSSAEQAAITAAPLNKVRAFTSRSVLRHTLGQAAPAIDLDGLLRDGRVVLVRLPEGLLGQETASLLGTFLMAQIWQAVAARAGMPPSERRPAMVIVDEVQVVLRLAGASLNDFLAQARGYGVGLTAAHQLLDQLPTELKKSLLANARSRVVFGCGRGDASELARELGAGLTADDLMGLDAFEAVTTVYAAGRTQPAATIRTQPLGPALRPAEAVKARSRQRYGADRPDIEAALQARLRFDGPDNQRPIGRSRRSI
ncbi:MAG: hypothetical protein QOK43_1971 [Acidimicrobiaceae bacterium]|nr:hypothetical protein [Acidimicrobiaceae bacterium]